MSERKSKKRKAAHEYYDVTKTHQVNTQYSVANLANSIKLQTLPSQTKHIKNYICGIKQRKNTTSTKMKGRNIIVRMLQKWHTRKLERDA